MLTGMLALRSASMQYFSGRPVALQGKQRVGISGGDGGEGTKETAEAGLKNLGIFFQNLSFHYVINLLIITYFVHADLEKTMLQRCSGVYTLGQNCKRTASKFE